MWGQDVGILNTHICGILATNKLVSGAYASRCKHTTPYKVPNLKVPKMTVNDSQLMYIERVTNK